MSLQTINNGASDNDASAEKIRLAFEKVKSMFSEIYGKIPFELAGEQGKILVVKATEDGFELVALSGGGDMLSSNNLSDIINGEQARLNLGLGSAATSDSSDFATSAQGAKADSALQGLGAGDGISIDATDPLNPIITNTETDVTVQSGEFNPASGILTVTLTNLSTVDIDLAAYTVLKIDGYEVKKGNGNTDYENIEVGDYCFGWESDTHVSFKVTGIPYLTNRDLAINISI